MAVSNDILHDVLQDILGNYVKGRKGLVDSENSAKFHTLLESLRDKWELVAPGFFKWFVQYKAEAFMSLLDWEVHLSHFRQTT